MIDSIDQRRYCSPPKSRDIHGWSDDYSFGHPYPRRHWRHWLFKQKWGITPRRVFPHIANKNVSSEKVYEILSDYYKALYNHSHSHFALCTESQEMYSYLTTLTEDSRVSIILDKHIPGKVDEVTVWVLPLLKEPESLDEWIMVDFSGNISIG